MLARIQYFAGNIVDVSEQRTHAHVYHRRNIRVLKHRLSVASIVTEFVVDECSVESEITTWRTVRADDKHDLSSISCKTPVENYRSLIVLFSVRDYIHICRAYK